MTTTEPTPPSDTMVHAVESAAADALAQEIRCVQEIIARHTHAFWAVEDDEDLPEPDGYLAMATEIVSALSTPAVDRQEVERLTRERDAFLRQGAWMAQRLADLQLPKEQHGRTAEWLMECGMPKFPTAASQPVPAQGTETDRGSWLKEGLQHASDSLAARPEELRGPFKLATPAPAEGQDAEALREQELNEIADGAWGDNPMVRGIARENAEAKIAWTEHRNVWRRPGAEVRQVKTLIGTVHAWRATFDDGRQYHSDTADEAKAYADAHLARAALERIAR